MTPLNPSNELTKAGRKAWLCGELSHEQEMKDREELQAIGIDLDDEDGDISLKKAAPRLYRFAIRILVYHLRLKHCILRLRVFALELRKRIEKK
jgi:predicted HTH domain antitoxin